jgi:transcription antitermination factor NusG
MPVPKIIALDEPQRQSSTTLWYAVHTRYQHESSVHSLLCLKGFETFFPTYKSIRSWKDRKKEMDAPLFPGYVFVADAHVDRLRVLSTLGVCAIVSFAGIPAIIPNHEIDSMRRAIAGPYPVEPHIYLKEGDRVRIARGPLTGVEGILVRKKAGLRLVISVDMLGRAAAMEIEGASIEPVARQPQQQARGSLVAPPVAPGAEMMQ